VKDRKKRHRAFTQKSDTSKQICIRAFKSLLDVPDSLLCEMFTYLSCDHHLLVLPFVCKATLNIITKHKNSWPSEFSFNERTGLKKYENYPFKIIEMKTSSQNYDSNIFKSLITMPITNLCINCNTGVESILSSGLNICNNLEHLTLNLNENPSWNWKPLIDTLSQKLKGLCLKGEFNNIFKHFSKLKLKRLEVDDFVNCDTVAKINLSELKTLKLSFDRTVRINSFFKRLQRENKILQELTIYNSHLGPDDPDISYLKHLKLKKLELINFSDLEGIEMFDDVSDLQELTLNFTGISNEYLTRLFNKSKNLKKIKIFRYHDSKYNINNDTFKELCKLNIQKLELKECSRITIDGFKYIEGLKLCELNIKHIPLKGGCLQYISNMPITRLTLGEIRDSYDGHPSGARILDDHFKYLRRLPLNHLTLEKLRITGNGLKYLVNTPLQILDLNFCGNITGDMLIPLYNTDINKIYIQGCDKIQCQDMAVPKELKCTTDQGNIKLNRLQGYHTSTKVRIHAPKLLVNIPESWLCTIFTYLSYDHHLLVLPFVCKTILNIITKHKKSWPSEFSFNEGLVNLAKYKNYPFKTIEFKYNKGKCNYRNDKDLQILKTMPINHLRITDITSRLADLILPNFFGSGLEYLTLNIVLPSSRINWESFIDVLSVTCNLKGLYLTDVFDHFDRYLNRLKLKELKITNNIDNKMVEQINVSELEVLSLTFTADVKITNFFQRIREENKTLQKLTIRNNLRGEKVTNVLSYLTHLKLKKIDLVLFRNLDEKILLDVTNLQELTLELTEISNDDLEQMFSKSLNLKKFTCFHPINSKYSIDDSVIKKLCSLNIQELKLSQCNITDEGFQYIKDLKLRKLNIIDCTGLKSNYLQYISNMSIIRLVLSEHRHVDGSYKILDDDLKYLKRLPLSRLILNGLQISGEGLQHVLSNSLESLRLTLCKNITGDMIKPFFTTNVNEIYIKKCDKIYQNLLIPERITCSMDTPNNVIILKRKRR
jgi:hypothetical protein